MSNAFDEYQDFTDTTAMYHLGAEKFLSRHPEEQIDFLGLMYVTGKLNGEAGEIAEEVFKALRDDAGVITDERRANIIKELGDALYYIARIGRHVDITLDEIAAFNELKLKDRQERGKITGSGNDR
jgi:NTP pyrophosphatase (non-canonical NTP hydrolase)